MNENMCTAHSLSSVSRLSFRQFVVRLEVRQSVELYVRLSQCRQPLHSLMTRVHRRKRKSIRSPSVRRRTAQQPQLFVRALSQATVAELSNGS